MELNHRPRVQSGPLVAAPGFEPGSRPNLGLAGYKPAALPLSYAAELVRVRCSAHRRRRSKRRTLLARASPCYLERTAGVEPAYRPVRSRVLIHLSYVRALEPPAGTDPALLGREPSILSLDDGGEWLPSQESNPPHVRLTAGRVHLARLMGMFGGESGSRTRHVDLARIGCSPLPSPCLVVVLSHTLRGFDAALSPD
jgi:hypothetical protein